MKRQRRSINCSAGVSECCREKLYISFAEIGWDDWILHPHGYDAYFCRGSCASAATITLSGSHYNTVVRVSIAVAVACVLILARWLPLDTIWCAIINFSICLSFVTLNRSHRKWCTIETVRTIKIATPRASKWCHAVRPRNSHRSNYFIWTAIIQRRRKHFQIWWSKRADACENVSLDFHINTCIRFDTLWRDSFEFRKRPNFLPYFVIHFLILLINNLIYSDLISYIVHCSLDKCNFTLK